MNSHLDADLYKVDTNPSSSRNMILTHREVEKKTTTVKKKSKLIFKKGFSVH